MKVLGLVGSGRKDGNTDTLVDKILEGAKTSGHKTNKVFLADLKISPIGDCARCLKAGRCSIEDDFDALMDEMLESDCIIFGTPLYWWGPSAQIRIFMDRWVCRMRFDREGLRAAMKGKKCVLAIPHGGERLSETRYLFGMMEESFEYMEMAYLGSIHTVAYKHQDVSQDKAALKHAFELGARLTEMGDIKKATGAVTFSFSKLA